MDSGMYSIVLLVLMFALLYFFMIRPENKRKKQAQAMRDSLTVGDEITTIGGIIGESAQARNELLSGGFSSGWKQLLDQGIADEAGFIESIQAVARESGDAFDQLVADSDSFTDALKQGLKDGVISSETLSEAV